jgi:hypothetical protein
LAGRSGGGGWGYPPSFLEDGPQEPDEFPGDGGCDFGTGFAGGDEGAIAAGEAVVSLVGDAESPGRLSRTAAPERGSQSGGKAILPGGFDEDAADVAVPSLGEATAGDAIPGGVLGGDQAEEVGEGAGMREAIQVGEFGEEGHGGEGVDAVEAAEPAGGGDIGFLLGEGFDVGVEGGEFFFELGEGQPVVVNDQVIGRFGPGQRGQPLAVVFAPGAPGGVDAPAAEKEPSQAVAGPGEVFLDPFAQTQEIPIGFLPGGGEINGGEFPGPVELDQLPGVPAVGFDPVSGAEGDEAGSDDVADQAGSGGQEDPLDGEPAGSGFVADPDVAGGVSEKLAGEAAEGAGIIGHGELSGLRETGDQDSGDVLTLGGIESDPCGIFMHDRPPNRLYVALPRPG